MTLIWWWLELLKSEFILFEKYYILIGLHRLLQSTEIPIPSRAPAICKLVPDNAVPYNVTERDIGRWRVNPRELVGKCFTTSEEIMCQTFLVKDFYVKCSGEAQFEVVFEDSGLDVLNVIDHNSMMNMVKDAQFNSVL